MSLDYNHVTLCGRLTKDVELKSLPSGQKVALLSIATNRVYTTKENERKEEVEFSDVVVFGNQAENSALYLKKGDVALVSGRLQTRSWEKDGVTHKRTEVIASSIKFGAKAPTPKVGNTDIDYPTPDQETDPNGIPF